KRLLDGGLRPHAAIGKISEHHAHAHEGKGGGETQHDGHDDKGEHQQAQVPVRDVGRSRHQDEQADEDGGQYGEAKPDFFSHGWLPCFPSEGTAVSICWRSSALTWTMSISLSTSTSSTSL